VKAFGKPSSERGVVVMISLVLLVVMTTMGVGLVYTTGRNDKSASQKINHSQALHASETCIQNILQWMAVNGVTAPPCKNKTTGRCYQIKNRTMASSDYSISGSQQKQQTKMARHKYQCEVSLLTTLSGKNNSGMNTGFSVGQSSAYGGASTQTKYIYLIRTKSNGTTSSAHVEVVASMIF
jgi:Tfp pilus assembly protein PilX